MQVRTFRRKARWRSAEQESNSSLSSLKRLDIKDESLTEEQIVMVTQQFENKLTKKIKVNIKEPENTTLRALSFLSENSLREHDISPSTENTLDSGSEGLVQSLYHGPSQTKFFDPTESLTGHQPNLGDIIHSTRSQFLYLHSGFGPCFLWKFYVTNFWQIGLRMPLKY